MQANAIHVDRFDIDGVAVISLARHRDGRGLFSETYRQDALAAAGISANFVQDNFAYSAKAGVVRGLHFQVAPHAQGKLVQCLRGRILDVAVDIRPQSDTFGRHVCVELSRANWKQLWVPSGFAHGYATLEDDCDVIYKVTQAYAPDCERGIAWNDPALAIDWRIAASSAILSSKDRSNPRLSEIMSELRF